MNVLTEYQARCLDDECPLKEVCVRWVERETYGVRMQSGDCNDKPCEMFINVNL